MHQNLTFDLSIRDLWGHCLSELQKAIEPDCYDTWIANLRGLHNPGRKIMCIEFPNKICKDWVISKYFQKIENVIHMLAPGTKCEPGTVFHSKGSLNNCDEEGQHKSDISFLPPKKDYMKKRPLPEFSESPKFKLHPDYTFENFVADESNRIAFLAAQKIVDSEALIYNPLCLYGPSGLGKTHLLQAIAHRARKEREHFKATYLSSEGFVSDFIKATRFKSFDLFKKQFRSIDILIIDDIEFIANKKNQWKNCQARLISFSVNRNKLFSLQIKNLP